MFAPIRISAAAPNPLGQKSVAHPVTIVLLSVVRRCYIHGDDTYGADVSLKRGNRKAHHEQDEISHKLIEFSDKIQ